MNLKRGEQNQNIFFLVELTNELKALFQGSLAIVNHTNFNASLVSSYQSNSEALN